MLQYFSLNSLAHLANVTHYSPCSKKDPDTSQQPLHQKHFRLGCAQSGTNSARQAPKRGALFRRGDIAKIVDAACRPAGLQSMSRTFRPQAFLTCASRLRPHFTTSLPTKRFYTAAMAELTHPTIKDGKSFPTHLSCSGARRKQSFMA